ncbi:unnamed protein product (macronuclear) [Paramecium tetraurelia]|uniref:non-specific serine/threonine protein kinase n=1 Tax=Paramecium tetraurelia TaxID=5888 RepID=A0D421_PARTE|nr:uncharacterized protein GSPATT00013253001 [Paramecium tetraurelia]CAK77788.1 unnamed protein product [Paramecium tetraurelia]|eukprot:XP_001445185.1 hypothetical protein (macronuclear) [Paramecium tetraurelia strain d4-2]
MSQDKKFYFNFTSPFESVRQIEIFPKSPKERFFVPKNEQFKQKTLVLQRNCLIICDKKGASKKYFNITNALLEIVSHPKLGLGISLTKNEENFTFYGLVEQWFAYMKKWCIQPHFSKAYSIIALIGQGSFAKVLKTYTLKVFKIQRISDRKEFAVKVFDKTLMQSQDQASLLKEIELLRVMNHKNIINIQEAFENDQYIYIVHDLYKGGELHKELMKNKTFSERGAFIIVQQLVEALHYVHSHGILHRDIKPENIILREEGIIDQVVLADFGLADYYRKDCKYMFTRCGTPGYIAPELLQDKIYDHKVDVYSCGVLFYYLLVGKGPFDSNTQDAIVKANQNGQIDLTQFTFTNECLDLLRGMLDSNPHNRFTLDQVKQSSFFKRHMVVNNQTSSSTSLESLSNQSESQTNSLQSSPYQQQIYQQELKSKQVQYASPLQLPLRVKSPNLSPLKDPQRQILNLQRVPIKI